MDLNDAHNIAQICQGVGFIGLAMWLIFANNSKADFREKLASPATAIEKATDGRYELLTPAPHKQALDTHNESELLAWEIQEGKKKAGPRNGSPFRDPHIPDPPLEVPGKQPGPQRGLRSPGGGGPEGALGAAPRGVRHHQYGGGALLGPLEIRNGSARFLGCGSPMAAERDLLMPFHETREAMRKAGFGEFPLGLSPQKCTKVVKRTMGEAKAKQPGPYASVRGSPREAFSTSCSSPPLTTSTCPAAPPPSP